MSKHKACDTPLKHELVRTFDNVRPIKVIQAINNVYGGKK